MKRYRGLLILLVLLAVVMIAAAVDKTVGDRLDFRTPPETFAPNAPFHIMHGWAWVYGIGYNNFYYANYQAPGRGYITLELDGEMLKPDFFLRDQFVEYWSFFDVNVRIYDNFWVYNFPDGLEGDHNFVLTYYFPCADAEVEFGMSHGFVCEDKPNAVVPVMVREVLVSFETP